MTRKSVWGAVAAGTAGTAAGIWAKGKLARLKETVRVERSIQIGRPATEVFSCFAQVERMPQFARSVLSVVACEDISVWVAEIEGRFYGWDVEIVQVVPKRVIAWKSYRGPEHSGRIRFIPLGEETLVYVEINYVPDVSITRLFERRYPLFVGDAIDGTLRDFKAKLESNHSRVATFPSKTVYETATKQGTGTFGPQLREE